VTEINAFSSALPDHTADARRLGRLRWRCRRGLLENDLILERFLDARGETLSEADIAALDRLLALGDDELWDLLSGRQESDDATVRPLLRALRAV
jgi:antitoxin CptB